MVDEWVGESISEMEVKNKKRWLATAETEREKRKDPMVVSAGSINMSV